MTMNASECVDKLNGLLKGERSACETYRQALEKTQDPQIKSILEANHSCHSKRVDTLASKITEYGGQPVSDSGVWGAFAKMMEGGAKMFGDKAAVSVLEEGEDKGLSDYKNLSSDSNNDVSAIVAQLMPKQLSTHAKLRDLKHSMS